MKDAGLERSRNVRQIHQKKLDTKNYRRFANLTEIIEFDQGSSQRFTLMRRRRKTAALSLGRESLYKALSTTG